jgi:hypothetical protein
MTAPLKPSFRAAIALFLICLASGCSKTPAWIMGKFEIDPAATMKEVEKAKADVEAEKKKGNQPNLAKGLALVFAPFAVGKLYEGSILTITANEIITTKAGNGTVVKFEVHETPTKNSVSIKTSEGKVETWTKTETGIAKIAEGDLPILVHFKRQP